jgi:hypothetical protein
LFGALRDVTPERKVHGSIEGAAGPLRVSPLRKVHFP